MRPRIDYLTVPTYAYANDHAVLAAEFHEEPLDIRSQWVILPPHTDFGYALGEPAGSALVRPPGVGRVRSETTSIPREHPAAGDEHRLQGIEVGQRPVRHRVVDEGPAPLGRLAFGRGRG